MFTVGEDDYEMMTVRPTLTAGGSVNRVTITPLEFQYYIVGGPVKISYSINSVLGTSSFVPVSDFTEVSIISGTSIGISSTIDYSIYNEGVHKVKVEDIERQLDRTLQLSVDGTYQNTFSISASTILPGSTFSISLELHYY